MVEKFVDNKGMKKLGRPTLANLPSTLVLA